MRTRADVDESVKQAVVIDGGGSVHNHAVFQYAACLYDCLSHDDAALTDGCRRGNICVRMNQDGQFEAERGGASGDLAADAVVADGDGDVVLFGR